MNARAGPRAEPGGQTVVDETIDTLKTEIPALARLFDALAAGSTPNFLDVMSAISEMVAFYTDSDQSAGQLEADLEKMSGKFCRICP